MDSFLFQAVVYLGAAVISVPVAQRLGLGSVLGYLIAGVLIGPVLGLVGGETQDLQHFAEFGVVMMLFLVGLELDPKTLWGMRNRLIGLGGLQVGLTVAVIAATAYYLGEGWRQGIAIGFILVLSSTAIVLQSYGEKGLMRTEGGEAGFSVLLFQDIAVIPMLAIIPLLAMPELMAAAAGSTANDAGHGASMSLVDGLPGWGVALVTLGAIAIVIFGGQYLSRPLFRMIAKARLRELFTATALLLVIAIALLMTLVGLSPALGTFLAGVVLANSEYRHELEADIEPFKGLLLGLFFITVGAGINFNLFASSPGAILGLTIGIMALKAVILFAIAILFGLRGSDRWLLALSLAQAGEFGFVLIAFSLQNSVIGGEMASLMSLVVALSMLITPALFIFHDRFLSRLGASGETGREADAIPEKQRIIVAGHGRFGQIVNRMLIANGFRTVVLDHRADVIDSLRKFGVELYYGDASRPDLLHAAGIEDAQMLVVAIDDQEQALEIVRFAKRVNPGIHVIARANDRLHVFRLYRAGADDIVRELFDSSVRAGRYALLALGMKPRTVQKAETLFVEHDRETLRALAQVHREGVSVFDNADYIDAARERNRLMQEAMAELLSSGEEDDEEADREAAREIR